MLHNDTDIVRLHASSSAAHLQAARLEIVLKKAVRARELLQQVRNMQQLYALAV
jgi:hypothetical protein